MGDIVLTLTIRLRHLTPPQEAVRGVAVTEVQAQEIEERVGLDRVPLPCTLLRKFEHLLQFEKMLKSDLLYQILGTFFYVTPGTIEKEQLSSCMIYLSQMEFRYGLVKRMFCLDHHYYVKLIKV